MSLIDELHHIEIINKDRLDEFYPRVRDRDDVAVLIDPITEVIVLSGDTHIDIGYYEDRIEKISHRVRGKELTTPKLEDNLRRAKEFCGLIRGKNWLDFGCGLGGMLDEMAREANSAVGLEPNRDRAAICRDKGHSVVESLGQIEHQSLDVVTLFHVMEHLAEPSAVLAEIRRCLKPEGKLIVEVPHARDALFTLYDCEAFKKFTFWSEHLVLHTRLSLKIILEEAGFHKTEIRGIQRYPLSNHLYWLSKSKPGGHEKWIFLSGMNLSSEYEAALSGIDRTDTLVSISYNPEPYFR